MDPSLRIQELEDQLQKLEVSKAEECKKASAAQRLKDASVKAVVAAESKIATLTCQVEAETQRATAAESRIAELEKNSASKDDCTLQSLHLQIEQLQRENAIAYERIAASEVRVTELESMVDVKADHSAEDKLKSDIQTLQAAKDLESQRAGQAEAMVVELQGKLERSFSEINDVGTYRVAESGETSDELQARLAALEDELGDAQMAKDLESRRADAAEALVLELNLKLEQLQVDICNERAQHRDALGVADSCILELEKAAGEGVQYKEKLAIAHSRIRDLTKELKSLKLQPVEASGESLRKGYEANDQSGQDDSDKLLVNLSSEFEKSVPNGDPNGSQADLPFDKVCGTLLSDSTHMVGSDVSAMRCDLEVRRESSASTSQAECDNVELAEPSFPCSLPEKSRSHEMSVENLKSEEKLPDAEVMQLRNDTLIWMSTFDATLQEAKLDSQREAAKKWCIDHTINSALDFKGSVDAFTQDLGLKPLQTKRLVRLLQSDATNNPTGAQFDQGTPVLEMMPELKSTPNGQHNDLNKVLTRTVSGTSKRSFAFLPPTADEATVPRNVRLRVHKTSGAGLDGRATWYGIVIDDIDDVPGQPDLQCGDCIVEIGGKSLQELDGPECEVAFATALRDGAKAVVETSCETCGELPSTSNTDCEHMWKDLEALSVDYEVKFKILPGTRTLVMSGSRPAVAGARNAATTLINKWI